MGAERIRARKKSRAPACKCDAGHRTRASITEGIQAMNKCSKLIHIVCPSAILPPFPYLPSHLFLSLHFCPSHHMFPLGFEGFFVCDYFSQFLTVTLDVLPLQQTDRMCLPILCLFATLPSPSWMYVIALPWRATTVSFV